MSLFRQWVHLRRTKWNISVWFHCTRQKRWKGWPERFQTRYVKCFFLFLFCNKVELFVFLSQTSSVYFCLMFILMHSREGKINTSPPPTTKRKLKIKYPWKKATLCTSCRTRSTTRNGCMVTLLEMKLSASCLHVFCTRNRMKITWMKTVRNICWKKLNGGTFS